MGAESHHCWHRKNENDAVRLLSSLCDLVQRAACDQQGCFQRRLSRTRWINSSDPASSFGPDQSTGVDANPVAASD
jgi:hypothetical protein